MQINKYLKSAIRMPNAKSGMKIGLFGGTFDPPHHGHISIANIAIKKLDLDQLWWIITPYNPFKNCKSISPLINRIELSKALVKNPIIRITAFEYSLNHTNNTIDTILKIKAHNKSVNFVWIMGADNITKFHRWYQWKRIVTTVPIAIIDRCGTTLNYISSPMAKAFKYAQLDESISNNLCKIAAPSWIFIHNKHHLISSTLIRKYRNDIDLK
ncbi:nicotinate-nucleotide adenylyltransferase [Candidatus Liberibacter americanus]|uniref:Probable nicotinate-nucleotide adenylyltransferase n=1 Tax=Candidatus Liberibacter americanus str. Sao Paulo TaxID=1261131 RepID=U6B441_9HYPH|nr:nicotinate-nucleotide adenylyltransferase [Candidatus Liberibacter americanus]AHA27403.1 Nicotinic acid mononucleotide adenylyltransferase [Candidatus Liberibacter americanus str. Sao Paulo]EMS36676.1 nicotinic acid mononucleotide adenylyltransferase [Candidatus Liberibacter americanus PW_SP]